MRNTVKILLICMASTMVFSCASETLTSVKGAVGDVVGMQTLSLEEVIKKSKGVPCEYDKDLYYKGRKVALIEQWSSIKSALTSMIGLSDESDNYKALLIANKQWTEKTITYRHCTYSKKKGYQCEYVEYSTQIIHITKVFSLDGKHQSTVVVYSIPVGKVRERKGPGEFLKLVDAYYYIDEANRSLRKLTQKPSDLVPYMMEFRKVMKIVLDSNPGKFPPEKIKKVAEEPKKKTADETKKKSANEPKKV